MMMAPSSSRASTRHPRHASSSISRTLLTLVGALLLVQDVVGAPLDLQGYSACHTCRANQHPALPTTLPKRWSGSQPVLHGIHDIEKRQTFGTDTIYTTSTTTVIVRPAGVTPLATTTRTATVTLPGDSDVPDPLDSFLRIVTETVTLTQAVEVNPFTLTERVTITVPAVVVPVPVTRTTTSVITSTTQAAPAPTANGGGGGAVIDNGQGREEAAQAQETGVPFDYTCRVGDANEKYPGGMSLSATENQRTTLLLIAIFTVGILVAWRLIGFATLIYPVKMLAVAYHEFWHILVGVCSGQKLEKVDLDPGLGGKTVFNAPEAPLISLQPIACYFVAMTGNALIGSLLVFCGFNTLASKIASFFIGLSYAAILWYASGAVVLALTLAWIGLMVGLWFIDHGRYLKHYVLFIGIATALYFIWDIMDDFIFRKVHPCCPGQLENRFRTDAGPRFFAAMWAGVWAAISILFFTGFVLLAVAVFRQTPHGEYCQGQTFLPT